METGAQKPFVRSACYKNVTQLIEHQPEETVMYHLVLTLLSWLMVPGIGSVRLSLGKTSR